VGPRSVAVALSITIAFAACSNDSDNGADETAGTTTTTEPTVHASDGQLKIGLMLPPAATLLQDPIQHGATIAVDRINEAGGVFEQDVDLIEVEEGDTAATGADAVQQLIDDDVDAIIGPASSTIAASTLTSIVTSGRVACSPTASALTLDDFPDLNLFFRTVPSDKLESEAIAQVAEDTGVPTVVVAYVDDGFGRPLSGAVRDALAGVPITVSDPIAFASGTADQTGTNLTASVQAVIDSEARVLILLADSNDGTRFLEALSDTPAAANISNIIVNDALRSPESAPRLAALRRVTRAKITGVAPQAVSRNAETPVDLTGPFATQAYDCATLIALAASIAGSDGGHDIAMELPSVSARGQKCHTFAECSQAALDAFEIDYDGPGGLTEIGASGDPNRAIFDVFQFDDDGHDTLGTTVEVAG
jgi:branched-chain amino acid transport system substrate-binding protein